MLLVWGVGLAWASPDDPPAAPAPPAAESAPLAGLEISGFAQFDVLRRQISLDELSDGSGEPLNEDRFVVRRARIRMRRDWRAVSMFGVVELFSESATVRPIGFEIETRIPSRNDDPPPLAVRAGLFPVPFGFESYEQTDDQRFFGERALFTSSLVPGRFDLGVALAGHVWNIDWIVAVQNGEPNEAEPYAYRDPNAAKDVSGRVRVSGRLVGSVRGAVGASVLRGTGFSPGTPPTKNTFEWQDLNEDGRVVLGELIPITGSAGRPSQNFARFGASGDAQLWADLPVLGELFLFTEVALGVNLDRRVAPADPVLLGRDQRSVGVLVGGTQNLTESVTVGARYEHYEPQLDALELFEGVTVVTRRPFQTWTVGASVQRPLPGNARIRLLAEAELQRNLLGRDANGRPAPIDNDTLRGRLEVVF